MKEKVTFRMKKGAQNDALVYYLHDYSCHCYWLMVSLQHEQRLLMSIHRIKAKRVVKEGDDFFCDVLFYVRHWNNERLQETP